jgi:hypothetical protein
MGSSYTKHLAFAQLRSLGAAKYESARAKRLPSA